MKKILLITNQSGNETSRATQLNNLQRFMAAINGPGLNSFEFCMVQELLFASHNGQISITHNNQELHTVYDAIHLRNPTGYSDFANALRLYCQHFNVALVNELDVTIPYFGKVSQGFLYTLHAIPTPDFVSSTSNQTLANHLSAQAVYPLIIKHNDGVMGLHNYLVHNISEMKKVLAQPLQGFVAQPFIKNRGELRVLTFGKDVAPLVFRKYASNESHLNNTSRGGGSEKIDPSTIEPKCFENALRAAELTHREVGGVDVLLGDDGRTYILEVNSTPAIASGVFAEEKTEYYKAYMQRAIATNEKTKGKSA